MNRYFLCPILAIASLIIFNNITPDFAKSAPTSQSYRSPQKAVDLTIAIDRFFKSGTLEESWFSPKEPGKPERFEEFRNQALDARKFILQLYGSYKSVRSESDTKYIAIFDKHELGLEFNLDSQGRITENGGQIGLDNDSFKYP